MISSGGISSFESLRDKPFDIFFYGLGFESRATMIVSCIKNQGKIFALKMPEMRVHAYDRNVKYAHSRKHRVVGNFDAFIEDELKKTFARRRGRWRIGFDISSVNRIMLVALVSELSFLMNEEDTFELFYCPAAYGEPSWLFPQIEKLGPISSLFSGFNSDPSKPLCVLLGTGFEAGVSMGIISQLEPSVSYCFWGHGVDERFDGAVKRANFEFDFPGFNTRVLSYNIHDPKGAFELIENVVYGLFRDYRVVLVPMGPKLFTALAVLIGMSYFGDVAVWRVQHSPVGPPDSLPGNYCVSAALDVTLLKAFSAKASSTLEIA
jgi:hypothetical protein